MIINARVVCSVPGWGGDEGTKTEVCEGQWQRQWWRHEGSGDDRGGRRREAGGGKREAAVRRSIRRARRARENIHQPHRAWIGVASATCPMRAARVMSRGEYRSLPDAARKPAINSHQPQYYRHALRLPSKGFLNLGIFLNNAEGNIPI